MNLYKIHPTDIGSSPETDIQQLMRNILIRTNFTPGVRHVIGWRGLKDVSSGIEGWTAKIKGLAGVFGIYFEKVETVSGWINGRFGLNYFPDPEEELVELFSLQAGRCTQEETYMEHIRDFLSYPELCELFNIGIVDLCIKQTGDALILSLESITKQRVIAHDGISFTKDGNIVELVKPDGFDQDFPSYSVALSFYHVLSSSITFNLEEPPKYLQSVCEPGTEVIYNSCGKHWEQSSSEVKRKYLYLGYGKVNFDKKMTYLKAKDPSAKDVAVWRAGDAIPEEFKDALWWNAHKISNYKTLDKQILGIDDRPQLIVLTGFLGSGKTSFLQHFIEYQIQLNRFVAIIQNEIGETGLDGRLLDHDYSVTEIDEGCVCCSLIGNLKNAIHQILSSFHPDYIVLETTGVANPYNLLDEISEVDELVKFDSITTVVDSQNMNKSLDEYEVVCNQIKAADVLLLNKIDLITEPELRKSKQKLKEINPAALILTAKQGDVNPALIYCCDSEKIKKQLQKKGRERNEAHAMYSHMHDGLSSHKISFTEALDRELFLSAIKALPQTIFRIKGVVDFLDSKIPLLFQYVGGRFEFSEFNNPKMEERFLIAIGQDINQAEFGSGIWQYFQQNHLR